MKSFVQPRRQIRLKPRIFLIVIAFSVSSCATDGQPAATPDAVSAPEVATVPGAGTIGAGRDVASLRMATIDVEEVVESRYRRHLGQSLAIPEPAADGPAAVELIDCQAQCDAAVPRQTLLSIMWQDPVASPGPMAPAYADESRIRLDISGTPNGFDVGNYGTIKLQDLQNVGEAMPSTADAGQIALQGQVLLNRVETNQVVPRPTDLPLFRSTAQMLEMLPTLPSNMATPVQREIQTGSLSQVRMLGRTDHEVRGTSTQAVTMTGLQPGLTYRFRMVEESANGDRVVVEQICRVPVCPADFAGERR